MDIAKCTDDGVFYSAVDFSRLLPKDLDRKRRWLQCPECCGPAFFRHASPIGRAACFGARPHSQDCTLAAQDCANDDQDPQYIPGSRIIVDFRYGATTSANFCSTGRLPIQDRAGYSFAQPHIHIHHQRLGPLLRTLIESPTFSSSDTIIEIEGRGNMEANEFFVPLQYAAYRYSGLYRGYWGLISDAKFALDKSLWFNSGGNDNISFCLDQKFIDETIHRYGIKELEDLAGAYILVMGAPRVAQNGKLYCLVEGVENMALRLT